MEQIQQPKTAMLAKDAGGGMLQCTACRRYCKIPEGWAGFCGVRGNHKGKLELVVYGRPAAVWADPVEKKPLFHFLPGTKIYSFGTFGCNFACDFCQNWDISQAPQQFRKQDPKKWREHFLNLVKQCREMPPEVVVENALANGCKSIAFTYNEPTIFTEYALDVMQVARKKGLKGVYVTNGYEARECWDAMKGLIDAANIDLKAYNNRFYNKLCKAPDYEGVKDSIEYARKLGIWVEVTTLLIPGWNDDEKELREEAEWLASVDKEMPWHVTAFHPDYKLLDKPPTPPETLLKARKIGLEAGLKHVYCGNLGAEYADYETTFCAGCGKPLVVRHGYRIMGDDVKDGKCKFCKRKVSGIWN
ncbi:MAG: AmmeMemoRadiSam system radical SAM enzyme [Candidatus Micrarchaeia archaeon]